MSISGSSSFDVQNTIEREGFQHALVELIESKGVEVPVSLRKTWGKETYVLRFKHNQLGVVRIHSVLYNRDKLTVLPAFDKGQIGTYLIPAAALFEHLRDVWFEIYELIEVKELL